MPQTASAAPDATAKEATMAHAEETVGNPAATSGLSHYSQLTVAALLIATTGVVIQMIAGVDFPTIPPVLFILLIPAGLVAVGRWRWTPATAALAGVFLTFGLFAGGAAPRLLDLSQLGGFVGLWVQMLGVIGAVVGGLIATVQNYARRRS